MLFAHVDLMLTRTSGSLLRFTERRQQSEKDRPSLPMAAGVFKSDFACIHSGCVIFSHMSQLITWMYVMVDPENKDDEFRPSPRVNMELTAQQQAGQLDSQLDEVRGNFAEIPMSDNVEMPPLRLVEALIRDSQSIIEGMQHGKITKGSSRVASNLIRAVELLEPAGLAYDQPMSGLLNVIIQLSQNGLTIDGYSLSDGKHTDRVKN